MSKPIEIPDASLNELQFIKGIGPKRAEALIKYGIKNINDLLYYIPFRYLDRTNVCSIASLYKFINNETEITIIGKVQNKTTIGAGHTKRFLLTISDNTGTLDCIWFGGLTYFQKIFEIGEHLAISGIPAIYNGKFQIVHPDYDKLSDEEDLNFLNTGSIIPHYHSSEELKKVGLDSRSFRRIFKNLLNSSKFAVAESLSNEIIDKNNLLHLRETLRNIHFPESNEMLLKALYRLKFEELFFLQLLVFTRKNNLKVDNKGIEYNIKSKLARRLVDSLHFELTSAQKKVIREITEDMSSSKAMNRMLQGDVGSGKTIVALITMLIAVESGYQASLMVPTEILAEQHFSNINNLLKEFGLNIRLLVGGQSKKLRNEILQDIQDGNTNIIIGTHALIEDNVIFNKLGLIIIDEQHRFGVMQRANLREKGINADVLVMTATPIPRTLSLTLYGDLDVSIIDKLPLNRKAIKTYLIKEKEIDKMYEFIREQLSGGNQAYIVYPLIEESEKLDLEAATMGHKFLSEEIFPEFKIGLIHSKLFSYEKDEIMQKFKARELNALVATTVIEVGIDIPNANIMVIQNSERFGLSQLHQLRGRIGRGTDQSYCFLISKDYLISKSKRDHSREEMEKLQVAARRLKTMVDTNDGFKIAEVDLEIRGPGDFFGTRQTGLPALEIANLVEDKDILEIAREDARKLLEKDPALDLKENKKIKEIFSSKYSSGLNLSRVG
jgi:ATP-dependent DNA helicase RecG